MQGSLRAPLWSCQCPVTKISLCVSRLVCFGVFIILHYLLSYPTQPPPPNNSLALTPQETFTDDCKFRERFQENSYNTYASVVHGGRRSGRPWYVALNKRGKAKMGSSPRVKAQHVSTHFLPRFALHEKVEHGFTIAERGQEKTKPRPAAPPPAPPRQSSPKAPAPKTSISTGQRPSQPVKYWPKFHFG